MSETIESPALNEATTQQQSSSNSRAYGPFGYGSLARSGSKARYPQGRWSSDLSAQNLQCLLQIIEADLIPRLLSGYSPARDSSVGRPAPG